MKRRPPSRKSTTRDEKRCAPPHFRIGELAQRQTRTAQEVQLQAERRPLASRSTERGSCGVRPDPPLTKPGDDPRPRSASSFGHGAFAVSRASDASPSLATTTRAVRVPRFPVMSHALTVTSYTPFGTLSVSQDSRRKRENGRNQ
jgi:hypothetical protein